MMIFALLAVAFITSINPYVDKISTGVMIPLGLLPRFLLNTPFADNNNRE